MAFSCSALVAYPLFSGSGGGIQALPGNRYAAHQSAEFADDARPTGVYLCCADEDPAKNAQIASIYYFFDTFLFGQ